MLRVVKAIDQSLPSCPTQKGKFKIGIRKLIEGLMIQRLGENDKIVTRYVEDQDFQDAAFDGLADEIFESVVAEHS
jgi:type I restriction enzyme, R subunit